MSGEAAEEWRDTADGVDWEDGGEIDLQYADGRIVRASLSIDTWFAGEDEIPLAIVNDGELSLFDAERWRPANGTNTTARSAPAARSGRSTDC